MARVIRREVTVARLQSDFVSAVSHEFRSPLTSVSAALRDARLDASAAEGRRQVYYETLVAKPPGCSGWWKRCSTSDGWRPAPRSTALRSRHRSPGARVAEIEAQGTAGRRSRSAARRRDARWTADRDAISVALRNLVDNALKYSPGQPTVWVEWGRTRTRRDPRRDSGAGIPPSEQQSIFANSCAAAPRSTANVKGTGVGLAMVRRSWRPRRRDPCRERARAGQHVHPASARRRHGMTRILVVEDEPGIALGARRRSQDGGLRREVVTTATWLTRAREMPSTRSCSTSCCRARTASKSAASCAARRPDAHPDAHRKSAGGRKSYGARARRRRLHDQAVRHPRAPRARLRRCCAAAGRRGAECSALAKWKSISTAARWRGGETCR